MRSPLCHSLLVVGLLVAPAVARVTTRASVHSDGTEGAGSYAYPSLTPDGRFVAFSGNPDLGGAPAPGPSVLLHDRQTGQTSLVSPPGQVCQFPFLSDDARFVAFECARATGNFSVYVRDRQTGELTLVSHALGGGVEDDDSYPESISADGRFIAFRSDSDDLVADDTNEVDDTFVADRVTGQITRVSVASDGTQSDGFSDRPKLSADGRFVVFWSSATSLVPDGVTGTQIYVHDRTTGATERVSVSSGGEPANGSCFVPAVSGDGRVVVFESYATNLVAAPTYGHPNVFVRDRQTGSTSVASAVAGVPGNGASSDPAISPDGRWVGFLSAASNLVSDDRNGVPDTFVYDRLTDRIERVSVDSGGSEAAPTGFDFGVIFNRPAIGDGGTIAFANPSGNLVAGDHNHALDVFVHDRTCGNGLPDPGEQCDDGNDVEGDGCDTDCTLSVCSGGAVLERAKLTSAKLGPPPGDEKLTLTGELHLPANVEAAFDPVAVGLQVRVDDLGNPGTSLLDLSHLARAVPPGAPGTGCGPEDGWKGASGRFTYRNRSTAIDFPACTPGSARGLTSVTTKHLGRGGIAVMVKTQGGSLPSPAGPLRATVVLGAAPGLGDAGECGSASFSTIRCRRNGSGTTLGCR
jgi:cysteine-rich repeat protein